MKKINLSILPQEKILINDYMKRQESRLLNALKNIEDINKKQLEKQLKPVKNNTEITTQTQRQRKNYEF